MLSQYMNQTASWDCPVKLWVFEEDVDGTQQLPVLLEKYFVWKQCFSWAILVVEVFSVFHWIVLKGQVRKQMRNRLCLLH